MPLISGHIVAVSLFLRRENVKDVKCALAQRGSSAKILMMTRKRRVSVP